MWRLLAEETLALLPGEEITVETVCGSYLGWKHAENICGVSIIRAGDSLLGAFRECIPDMAVGCYFPEVIVFWLIFCREDLDTEG
jgi:uracil phosphoribosyltransferase